ncbi:MAG TPA: aminomethyltransferase beta-barrel domain-containing protein, partial [Candidatus Limnocylindrales bacterium]
EPPALDADGAFVADVRIRHRGKLVRARVRPPSADPGTWTLAVDEPVWAAAPGQAAVLYDGEAVLGGGRIVPAGTRGTATC